MVTNIPIEAARGFSILPQSTLVLCGHLSEAHCEPRPPTCLAGRYLLFLGKIRGLKFFLETSSSWDKTANFDYFLIKFFFPCIFPIKNEKTLLERETEPS